MNLLEEILNGLPTNPNLRQKVADLGALLAASETENAGLKDDIREAKAEIAELKQQIEELEHKDPKLEDTQCKLLQLLSVRTNPDHVEGLSSLLDEEDTVIQFHLGQLEKESYVISTQAFVAGQRIQYSLTQKGREYLVRNGLVLRKA